MSEKNCHIHVYIYKHTNKIYKCISEIVNTITCLGKNYVIHVLRIERAAMCHWTFLINILANIHKSFKRLSSVQFINALHFNIFGLE